jgi:hypothetical protein
MRGAVEGVRAQPRFLGGGGGVVGVVGKEQAVLPALDALRQRRVAVVGC